MGSLGAGKDNLPSGFAERAEDYIGGGGSVDIVFTKNDIAYMKKNAVESTKPIYRIEDARFTADKLDNGTLDKNDFRFEGSMRSFSSSMTFINDSVTELYSGNLRRGEEPVVFQVEGTKKEYDINRYADTYRRSFSDQAERLVGGRFKVIGERKKKVDGIPVRVIRIRQIGD